MDRLVPSLADRFELGPLVAAGRAGEVYRGRERTTGREVAIKRVAGDAIDEATRRRFGHEATRWSALAHANVVGCVAHGGDASGGLVVVTDWLDGETLASRLVRDGVLSLASTLAIVGQMAEGLEALHAIGLFHRDLRPGNVFLVATNERLTARLVDVGVATRTRAIEGIDYLAPEQAEGEASIASDVYAMAMVFFECIAGRRASRASGAPGIDTLRPDLPSALDAVVARALDADPTKRFANPRAFVAALFAACETVSSGLDADEITLQIQDPARRPRRAPTRRTAGPPSPAHFEALLARADASLAQAHLAIGLTDARAALIAAGDSSARVLSASIRIARAESDSGRPVEASEALRSALAATATAPQSASRIEAELEAARILVHRGRATEAQGAVERIEPVDDATRALKDEIAAEACLARGDFETALLQWAGAERCADPAVCLRARVGTGRTLLQLGEYTEAASELRAAADGCARNGMLGDEIIARAVRAVALARSGRPEAGAVDAHQAVALASRAALPRAGAIAAVCAAWLDAEAAADAHRAHARPLRGAMAAIEPFAPLRAVADALRARDALASGDRDEATRLAAGAFLLVERASAFDGAEGIVLLAYGEALAAAERAHECEAVMAQARRRLLDRAARLHSESRRSVFLARVPEHRALLALADRYAPV